MILFIYLFISQIPVNKVMLYGDLRNVLMKRIFLSALHFRINARYKVHYCYHIIASLVFAGIIMIVLFVQCEVFVLPFKSFIIASQICDSQ